MILIKCSNGHENTAGSRFCASCGESLLGTVAGTLPNQGASAPASQAHPVELLPGMQLRNRYIIIRQLGQGGFGKTYLAEDTGRFNEAVVLKELTPNLLGTGAIKKASQLFEREAVTLHKLQHPQIPRFWELFREGKRLFLVQEWVEGETFDALLRKRLQRGECFREGEIVQLLSQLLPVLSYLHRLGVIHRDISPDNIIYRQRDGLPVLIDFGGVKQVALELAGGSESGSFTRLGKSGYAPDEQMRLGIAAPHSDLYALAVTAVVLMTGKTPQELIDPLSMDWLWEKQLKLSPKLQGILNRMLAQQPVERFQSAEEILELLAPNFAPPATQMSYTISAGSRNAANADPAPVNNSGEGGIFSASQVPAEIRGWNWGAFLLPGLWCITNHVWIGLIAWVDITLVTGGLPSLTVAFILGAKGNEWAWRSRRWKSIAAFKAHQRAWAIVAVLIWVLILLAVLLLVFGIVFWGFSAIMGGN
jgi:serine/threonine-protein kinase